MEVRDSIKKDAAPSVKNRQPWKFIVYTDAATQNMLQRIRI